MYWNNTVSNLEKILEKEGVTLEEVLNEDDVLQECIGQNAALVHFLRDDNQISDMLSVIISEPTETANDMERFKNANTVCEILTYENNPFADIIVSNEKFMSQLWSFVSVDSSAESPESEQASGTLSLNPLLASFFTKVYLHLFMHKTDQVMDFLARQEAPNDLVSVILRHINTSAIMDLIYKSWEYINIDTKNGTENITKYTDLLQKNCFIERLINIFGDTSADSKQQNSAFLVSDLVKTGRELLTSNMGMNGTNVTPREADGILVQFEQTEVSRSLLQNMFKTRTKHSVASGLKIIQDLLVYRIQVEALINQQNEQLSSMTTNGKSEVQDENMEGMPTFLKSTSSPSPTETQFMPPQLASPENVYGEHLDRCVHNVSAALHERLEDFVDLLVNPCPEGLAPIPTTAGVIKCPLGLIRIEVIHLFVALFATSDYSILEKCSQLNALKLLTDLFFEYTLNNQLHKYYEQIIWYIFQNYSNFKNIRDKHSANVVLNGKALETAAEAEEVQATEASATGDEAKPLPKSDENPVEKPEKSSTTPPGSNGSSSPPNEEKILHFIKLYEITKVLVKQILVDCRLLERILDSYAHEDVPRKSRKNEQPDATKSNLVDGHIIEKMIDNYLEEDPGKSPKNEQTDAAVPPVPAPESTPEPSTASNEATLPIMDETHSTEDSEVKMEVDQMTASGEEPQPAQIDSEPSESPATGEVKKEEEEVVAPEKSPLPVKKASLRPGYMGHLRLIANVLKERCSEELLRDCELDEEVIQQWNEFKAGKLVQLNDLVNNKLVEESKYESSDQELFQKYQIESTGQSLALNINMFASEFGQSSLGDINQQLKMSTAPEFDFDKYWPNSNEKLTELERYFDEKCSSIFDDEDEEEGKSCNADNPLGVAFKKERPSLLAATMQDDFATFDDDPFLSNSEDSKGEYDAGFVSFEQMNQANPWGEDSSNASNRANRSTDSATKETALSPGWADFSNDPFSSAEKSPTKVTEAEIEPFADFQAAASLPAAPCPEEPPQQQQE